MKKNSKTHHYIPQFYLRNFTNDQNKFHIYLVKEEKYKANGMLFSPKTHFFEEHGNTTFFNNKTADFLETDFYSPLDNEIAKLFNKIRLSNESRFGLTEADMPSLQFFIAHLFWRNPANDVFVKELLRRKGLTGLGITIKDPHTDEVKSNSKIEEDIIKNESTYKVIKYWLPLVLFKNLLNNNSPLTILRFNPGEKPFLMSDNPLILRNPHNYDVYGDDFILPLSRDKILIRGKNLNPFYENTATVLIDHLLVRQSNNFISTTDLGYVPMLNSLKENLSIEELRKKVFECFFD